MTIKEWKNKIAWYYKQYDYYTWAVIQPSVNKEQNETNKRLRDFYYNKWQSMVSLEEKILEKEIKSLDKADF